MKKRTPFIIVMTLLGICLIVFAGKQADKQGGSVQPMATLTINIPQNDVPRVSAAYGALLGLNRGATMNEVASRETDNIMTTVKTYERSTYTPPPLEMQSPTPTPAPTATP